MLYVGINLARFCSHIDVLCRSRYRRDSRQRKGPESSPSDITYCTYLNLGTGVAARKLGSGTSRWLGLSVAGLRSSRELSRDSSSARL
ncbi:hypothetical protein M8818_006674 [Zalaria obscura]|uniref:Uncharacterized protein n=1 Tax=Zalaria obscura TaxID=2024903 RepID=A0ACC3S560_9PEZI